MAAKVLLPLALLVLLAASGLAHVDGILSTNNVVRSSDQDLNKDEILSYDTYRFFLDNDCRLKLLDGDNIIWQSKTPKSSDCTVKLERQGQFAIRDSQDNVIARVPNFNPRGQETVAVLHPDGHVVIYGPRVWSQPRSRHSPSSDLSSTRVKNIIFSRERLDSGEKLAAGRQTLVMRNDCNLVLSSGWSSNTAGRGQNCYTSLNRSGRLSVFDGNNNELWTNGLNTYEGEYAGILFRDGQFAIYGHQLWSTQYGLGAVAE